MTVMPRLTENFLEALDRLSRTPYGFSDAPVFVSETQANSAVSMGYAAEGHRSPDGGRGIWITEPGKRLVEAYRLGKRSRKR